MSEDELVDLTEYKAELRRRLPPTSRLLQRVNDEPDKLPRAVLLAKLEHWNDLLYEELSG